MNLDETQHLVDFSTSYLYNNKAISTRIMYDDYDLDYTYAPSYEYDLDETYDAWVQSHQLDEDLDEEYTRDAQDYYALAYKHYA